MSVGAMGEEKSPNIQQPSTIDNTISTLLRCLKLAGASTEDPAVPAWPHDQHAISDDQAPPAAWSNGIQIVDFKQDESQLGEIMKLITKDLSEPYSIYTYRYFIHNWPDLCLLAVDSSTGQYVGTVICKMDRNKEIGKTKGYVAMLAVDEGYRRMGIGTKLVRQVIEVMVANNCDEVVLETEVSNANAQRLYQQLGFIREKRLYRYYLNGGDAFRLKMYFSSPDHSLASQQWSAQEVA